MALTKITADVIENGAITSDKLASGAVSAASLSSITTDNVSEGSTNVYYTDTRARSSVSVTGGNLSYDSGTGVIQLTTDTIRGAISVTDAGGDGSLAYSAGVITYTGPSAAEVRAHFSGSTGVSYNSSTGAFTTSAIPNASLSNSSITINSNSVDLGASVTLDTDDIGEGSTNLYYTDARVDSRLASGNVGNIVTTGYIAGPSTFTIDPAAVGDNTGTVVIAGDLRVDGTTTTINSTTLTVDDKNILLGQGAALASDNNGAGITVDTANASITYDSTNDEWDFNKDINVTGTVTTDGLTVDGTGDLGTIGNGVFNQAAALGFQGDRAFFGYSSSQNTLIQSGSNKGVVIEVNNDTLDSGTRAALFASNGDISFYEDTGTTVKLFWDASAESLGIGTTSPQSKLDVEGGNNVFDIARFGSSASDNSEVTIGYFDANATNGIPGLISSSDFGGLIQGGENGHLVLGIRDNDATDALDIVSGGGNFMSDSTYDTLIATFKANGNVGIGTDSSTHKLHIDSNGNSNSVIRIDADDNRGASRYALDIVDDDTNSRGSVRISTTSGQPVLIQHGTDGKGIQIDHTTVGGYSDILFTTKQNDGLQKVMHRLRSDMIDGTSGGEDSEFSLYGMYQGSEKVGLVLDRTASTYISAFTTFDDYSDTSNNSNYFELGTWSAGASSRITIRINGSTSYSNGINPAGETVIHGTITNAPDFEGFFYGITSFGTITNVAIKQNASEYTIYVLPGTYSSYEAHVTITHNSSWTPKHSGADTGSTSAPAGSTQLQSLYSISTAGQRRLTIDSSGNVNIGNGAAAERRLIIDCDNPLLVLKETDQAVDSRVWATQSIASKLYFRAMNDALSSATDVMVLDRSGNVGIGTSTAPGANGGGLAIYKSDYPRITLRNSTSGDTTSDGFQAALVGSDMQWDLAESGNQKFFIAGGEYMRLNSLGQLCIGDASYFPTSGTNVFYMRKDSTSTQFLSHYNLQGGLVSRYYGDYGNDGTIAELQIKVGDDGNEAKIQTWSNSVLKFGTNNTYAMEIGTNQSLYVGGTQQGADINDGRIFSYINSTNVPACRFAQGSTSTGIPVMRVRHENASNGNYIEFRTDENVLTGKIYDSSGTMQYTSQSDQRLKENVEPMTEGLTEVLAMNPVKYTLKDIVTENKTISMEGAENRGFLAQELNEQYPWAVEEGGEDPNMNPWGVDYGKLTPVLVKAIQELSAKLEAAEARITELEG